MNDFLKWLTACNRHDIGWNYLPCNNQSQTYKVYLYVVLTHPSRWEFDLKWKKWYSASNVWLFCFSWIKDCNPNSSEAISLPPPEGPFRCVAGCVEGWYKPFGYRSVVIFLSFHFDKHFDFLLDYEHFFRFLSCIVEMILVFLVQPDTTSFRQEYISSILFPKVSENFLIELNFVYNVFLL